MVCSDYLTFVAKGGDSRVNFVLFLPQIKSWSCTLHLKIVKMHRNLIPWWSLKLVYDKASSQALVPTYHPYHPTHIEGAIKSCNCKNFYYPTSSSVRGGPKNEATATVVLHSGLISWWPEKVQNYWTYSGKKFWLKTEVMLKKYVYCGLFMETSQLIVKFN